MNSKRPKGVTFIGYFYILGAVVLLFSLIFRVKQDISVGLRFGVPNISEFIIIPIIIIFSLILSHGYLELKKWGYWLMMVYSLIFLFISLNLLTQYNTQPFIGNAIWSILVIAYTYRKRKNFCKHL